MAGHLTLAYRITWLDAGSMVTMPGALSIEPRVEAASGPNGLGWGTLVSQRATITATLETANANYLLRKIQAEISVNGGAYEPYFTGVLLDRDSDGTSLRYSAGGFDALIARETVRTLVRARRPIATQTTLSSNEDPTTSGYRGGLANELFWRAGGRSLQQAAFFPDAPFYYSCHATPVAPEFGWSDGENAWNELLALAEAGGGQIFQTADGTVHYVAPLRLSESIPSPPHFTPSVYKRLTFRDTVEGVFNVASSTYVDRAIQPSQTILDDATPRQIAASGVLALDLAMEWPIAAYGAVDVVAVTLRSVPVTVGIAVTNRSAQVLSIALTNPIAEPILIARITVEGQPITMTQEGVASFTGPAFRVDGKPVAQRLNDSVLIQNAPDALRRCRMAVRWYGVPRRTYVARECPFTPALVVGQYALLSSTLYGLTAEPCRVTAISTSGPERKQDVTLVPLSGIPSISQFFVVGQSYADGDTRKVGF